jgi:hypothetical protein
VIGENANIGETDRPETPSVRSEQGNNLSWLRWASIDPPCLIEQFLLLEGMVTPQKYQYRLTIEDIHERLDLVVRSCTPVEHLEIGDRPDTWRVEPLEIG